MPGLIHEPIPGHVGFLGGISGELPVLLEDGNWEPYLPDFEAQRRLNLETMNCFTYDTQVLMEDYKLRNICDVQVGDSVITHEGRKRKVTEVMKRPYKGDLIVRRVKGVGEDITCTPEHPFLTTRGWVEAKKLTRDDKVVCPVIREKTEYRRYGIEDSPDFMWLLGVYIAEGSICDKISVVFSISTEEKEFAERIKKSFFGVFGKELHEYVNRGTKSLRLHASSESASRIFSDLGGKLAWNKSLAPHLLEIDTRLQLEILRGWMDGDGYLRGRRLQGVTTSKNLANQFRHIIQRLGLRSTMMVRKPKDNHREAYDILISGTGINTVYPDSVQGERTRNVASVLSGDGNYFVRGIVSVKKRTTSKGKADGYKVIYNVYNIEVEEDHSYVVSSVAVHNCVQFSRLNVCETLARFHGKQLNLSDLFLAWAAGCTPEGNTYTACDYWIRRRGCCDEGRWPWLVPVSWDEYVMEPPEDVKDEALRLLDKWDFGMLHWVNTDADSLREALKYGPIWFCNHNHSMVIYRVDDRIRIFDTYGGGIKSEPLSYAGEIRAAYLAPFTPKGNEPMKLSIPDNCLVAIVDGHGERYMSADGTRLYFSDDYGKTVLELIARNSRDGVFTSMPVVHMRSADVQGIPVYDFKNNLIR